MNSFYTSNQCIRTNVFVLHITRFLSCRFSHVCTYDGRPEVFENFTRRKIETHFVELKVATFTDSKWIKKYSVDYFSIIRFVNCQIRLLRFACAWKYLLENGFQLGDKRNVSSLVDPRLPVSIVRRISCEIEVKGERISPVARSTRRLAARLAFYLQLQNYEIDPEPSSR